MSKGETQVLSRLALIREYKKGGCRCIGYGPCKGRLEFHEPGKNPHIRISQMARGWKSMEYYRAQIAKKIPLCVRHHGMVTNGKIPDVWDREPTDQLKFSFLKD